MSYKDVLVRMGLVDVEYSHTASYSKPYVNLPVYLSPDQVYSHILWGRETYVCGTLKASSLGQPVFCSLYTILSWTLNGIGNIMGVVNLQDLYFLWSMVVRELIQIGHVVAC